MILAKQKWNNIRTRRTEKMSKTEIKFEPRKNILTPVKKLSHGKKITKTKKLDFHQIIKSLYFVLGNFSTSPRIYVTWKLVQTHSKYAFFYFQAASPNHPLIAKALTICNCLKGKVFKTLNLKFQISNIGVLNRKHFWKS